MFLKILMILTLSISVFGAPAFSGVREFKQADGTTFRAHLGGDEHLNWVESENGDILVFNKSSNNFEYATIENKKLKASGTKYMKPSSLRSLAPRAVNIKKVSKDELSALWQSKRRDSYKRRNIPTH